MTERNLKKELQYFTYTDMERGNDITSLDYPALIGLLTELMSRVEKLEAQLNGNVCLVSLII